MDVRTTVNQFIQSELLSDREIPHLKDTDPLITTGIIDSLGLMKLVAFLEKTFSIRLEDEEIVAENFETVDTISLLVQRKMA